MERLNQLGDEPVIADNFNYEIGKFVTNFVSIWFETLLPQENGFSVCCLKDN
jgi:hypothetical protein